MIIPKARKPTPAYPEIAKSDNVATTVGEIVKKGFPVHYFALEPDFFYSCNISYDKELYTYKVFMEKHGPLNGHLHEWPVVEFEIKALGALIFEMNNFDKTESGTDALDQLLITEYNTRTN